MYRMGEKTSHGDSRVAFCYVEVVGRSVSKVSKKEGNVLFHDALNTFYLRLYGVGHMVKDHSESERGNPLLFPISSKGSFKCTILQIG